MSAYEAIAVTLRSRICRMLLLLRGLDIEHELRVNTAGCLVMAFEGVRVRVLYGLRDFQYANPCM